MKWLLQILRSVFLLVCLAGVVLCGVIWVRSYGGTDYIERRWVIGADAMQVRHESVQLSCTRGQVRFSRGEDAYYSRTPMTAIAVGPTVHWSHGRLGVRHVGWEGPGARSMWNRMGFGSWQTGWSSSFADSHEQVWGVPVWLAMLVFAGPCFIWVAKLWRNRRRVEAGLCVRCGYDLRATRGRCPECGWDVAS